MEGIQPNEIIGLLEKEIEQSLVLLKIKELPETERKRIEKELEELEEELEGAMRMNELLKELNKESKPIEHQPGE